MNLNMKLPPHPKYMSKDFEKCEVKLMKQHLEDYIEVIKQLPLKKKYTKDEINKVTLAKVGTSKKKPSSPYKKW